MAEMTSKLLPVFILLLTATLKETRSLNTTAQPVTNEVTQPSVTLILNRTTSNVNLTSRGISLENQTTAEPISTGRKQKTLQNILTTLSVDIEEKSEDIKPTNSPEVLTELKKIFNVDSNNSSETSQEDDFENINSNSTSVNCLTQNSTDLICFEGNLNDTSKTNYTLIAEAMESLEYRPTFRLQKSAAIAAAVFLLTAIAGYLSCVTYRRYLQRKYGDSQRVAPEDVYDTTDLRYFEI